MATTLERKLVGFVRQAKRMPLDKLLERRYERIRCVGKVLSDPAALAALRAAEGAAAAEVVLPDSSGEGIEPAPFDQA